MLKILNDTFFQLLIKFAQILILLSPVLLILGIKIKSQRNIAIYLISIGIVLSIFLTFFYLINLFNSD